MLKVRIVDDEAQSAEPDNKNCKTLDSNFKTNARNHIDAIFQSNTSNTVCKMIEIMQCTTCRKNGDKYILKEVAKLGSSLEESPEMGYLLDIF